MILGTWHFHILIMKLQINLSSYPCLSYFSLETQVLPYWGIHSHPHITLSSSEVDPNFYPSLSSQHFHCVLLNVLSYISFSALIWCSVVFFFHLIATCIHCCSRVASPPMSLFQASILTATPILHHLIWDFHFNLEIS